MSTSIVKNKTAEEFISQPPSFDTRKTSFERRDPKDVLISRLKNVNFKLREHLKDLNDKLEIAIDKSQTIKKPKLPLKEVNQEDEVQKLHNQIDRIKREMDKIQTTFNKEEMEEKLQESLKKTAELK